MKNLDEDLKKRIEYTFLSNIDKNLKKDGKDFVTEILGYIGNNYMRMSGDPTLKEMTQKIKSAIIEANYSDIVYQGYSISAANLKDLSTAEVYGNTGINYHHFLGGDKEKNIQNIVWG